MTRTGFFAPGKVVLCGEYAVLVPGGEALVAAVSAGISARLRASSELELRSPILQDGPGKLGWSDGRLLIPEHLSPARRPEFRFVYQALEVAFGWLEDSERELLPFKLELLPKCDPLGPMPERPEHLGLGASSATVVSAIAAILDFHGVNPLTEEGRGLLFRLAATAHRRAQDGWGSGMDVAAAVYGGVVWFRNTGELPRVASVDWPDDLPILVGWRGKRIDKFARAARVELFRWQHPNIFGHFVANSRAWTRTIVQAIEAGERVSVLRALAKQRHLLLDLGEYVDLEMESPELRLLARAAGELGVSKSSGPGGGDCAVMVLRAPTFLKDARDALKISGMRQLFLSAPVAGVSREASMASRARVDQ